ncbi:acyl-CoA thioesterase-1 [Rhodobium orientis]|uniref:Arylesterase n=1 Tax=Rhodobium orientis TaxID=34017 RepID=A0A327JTN1_9HYPH|nr:arylesterase [Rhodobium orientis]MBB4305170.1 acyl-CoA thioesterase-1 [Rhodobium orientis]MBK5949242.1 arylesterase [Rhodobium orientis]RAI26658.1 arylesterase [Rhodobium orientis]
MRSEPIVFLSILGILFATFNALAEERVKIVALGDSLTAGYGLPPGKGFPTLLEGTLRGRNHDVEVVNAGVSGDTSSGGLARFDWSVPKDADALIVALGANDALRGIDPDKTRAALEDILKKAKARGLPVLLAGMLAPPNMGPDYQAAFDPIYPELAEKYGAVFYPFFLEGVAAQPKLNQDDGMHPNVDGVRLMVKGILPKVEELIARAKG